MRPIIFAAFLMLWFFSAFAETQSARVITAEAASKPIDNPHENPIPIADIEGEPSAVVNGVNVITGDFIECQCDMVFPGIKPLPLQRSCYSTDHRLGNLSRAWNFNFGSALQINEYSHGKKIHYNAALLEGSSSTAFEFNGDHKHPLTSSCMTISKGMIEKGVTNTNSGFIGGRTNIKNIKVFWEKKKNPHVRLSSGTQQYFDKIIYEDKYAGLHQDTYFVQFQITSEVDPNGDQILYKYHKKDHLKTIYCLSKAGKKLASYEFERPSKKLLDITTEDKRHILYHFSDKGQLSKVDRPDAPWMSYQYETRRHIDKIINKEYPDKRFLKIDYYQPGYNQVGVDSRSYEEDDWHIDRVSTLQGPVGSDATPVITHRFFYEASRTFVYDALHYQTHYNYNADQRLTAIQKYDANNKLYCCEKFYWGAKGSKDHTNLMARTFEDQHGQNQFARLYQYDDHGNVLNDWLYGNLTGVNPKGPLIAENGTLIANNCECFGKRYAYSNDGLNLVTLETDGMQAASFFYEPGTDRLSAKLKGYNNVTYQREFYEYNADGALVKEIIDNGTQRDKNNLQSVTERHIKLYTPRTVFPCGLPEVIEERCLNLSNGSEQLVHKTTNLYTPQGRLEKQGHYGSNGQLAYTLSWKYDPHGNIIKEIDAIGRTVIRKYDDNDNLTFEKVPSQDYHKTFEYDCTNRLIKEEEIHTDGTHLTTTHRYDYLSNRIATIDPYGNETNYKYDAFRRVIQTIHPPIPQENGALLNPATLIDYDAMSHVTRVIDARGLETTISYNIRGQPVTVASPDQSSEETLYYLNGLPKSKRAKNGAVTTFAYDYAERPIKQETRSSTGELLSMTSAVYDTFHLLTETDPAGHVTTYEYNPDGMLRRKTKGTHATAYQYDALGRIAKTIETYGPHPEDTIVKIQKYDLLNRVVEERMEDHQETVQSLIRYEYDISGNRSNVINYLQQGQAETKTTYNSHQQPCKVVDAEGNVTTIIYRYDYSNQYGQYVPYKEMTDPMGTVTMIISDALGREVEVIRKNPMGQIIQKQEIAYDAVGNRVALIETALAQNCAEKQIITRWTYDACNRETSCVEAVGTPEQKQTTAVYNECGQRAEMIKPDGIKLLYTYDALGRQKSFYASDNTFHYTYEYDLNSNLIKANDLEKHVQTIKTYDENDLLIQEKLGNGLTLSYAYDGLGRPTVITLPDGSTVDYQYQGSQLKEVRRTKDGNHYSHAYESYDRSGHVLEAKMIGNAGNLSYKYDLLGRLRETQTPCWTEKITEYDKVGNLKIKEVQDVSGTVISTFAYDDLYQLKSESGAAEHQYAYDSLYNCIEKDGRKQSFNYLNQLLDDANSRYIYHLNGNLFQKSTGETYTYDALDRLISYSKGKLTVYYLYDELNRRLSKTITEEGKQRTEIRYIYQGQNEVGACDEQGTIVELRLLGIGKGAEIGAALAVELGGRRYAPIHDHQGNLASLVDEEGRIFETYRYTAFGEELFDSLQNPWRFSSKRIDQETGLIYFGRRYYDPGTARWLTSDPIGYASGSNLYAYVLNNPLIHVDLYGLFQSPGEIGMHHTYRKNKDGTYARAKNDFGKYILRAPGMAVEQVGHHLIPIPFVKDLVEFTGWCLGFNNPTKYVPDWKRPHSQTIDFKGPNGQLTQHSTVMVFSGLGVPKDEKDARLEKMSEDLGGIDLIGVYKGDRGFALNLFECMLQRFGVPVRASEVAREAVSLATERVGGTNGTIFAIAHSQGGLILDQTDAMTKKKMVVFTLGSAKIAQATDYKKATNYIGPYDIVPFFDASGLFKGAYNGNVHYIKSIGNPMENHFFESETYQHELKKVFFNILNTAKGIN